MEIDSANINQNCVLITERKWVTRPGSRQVPLQCGESQWRKQDVEQITAWIRKSLSIL